MATQKQITRFRHFNRFYTNYLGILGNSVYDRPVSLSEARILYELDTSSGVSARELQDRLGLDKGYLSRMLKRFGKEGWLTFSPSEADARVKELSLTSSGTALMEQLHDDASRQAESALSGLGKDERAELLNAMAAIEAILSP